MIPSREVLALRDEWRLRTDVIEKDWALGWMLAGIAAQPALASWVFKGGTALRKCYYETYRFSEDLDFTVVEGGPDDPEQVMAIFGEIADWLDEHAGLELVVDDKSFTRTRTLHSRRPASPATPSSIFLPRSCALSRNGVDRETCTTLSTSSGIQTYSAKRQPSLRH